MKSFNKGLLIGLLLAFGCVSFMASKTNDIGRYQIANGGAIMDTSTGTVWLVKNGLNSKPYASISHD
tara:strand:- start:396 stop:596 length:201 start_codon:yes stop_codon:yes gene_type:complete